jgi:hypothetical protein
MNSPTSSPNSSLNLLMDNQGCASSSLIVSIVPKYPGRQENAGRLWTNAQFQFLLDTCEEKFYEYNRKLFREANWKDVTRSS